MALKRIMGTETEYGITGGDASSVVSAYKNGKKEHANLAETNQSILPEYEDVGGHIGGDYGSLAEQLEAASPNIFSHTNWINRIGAAARSFSRLGFTHGLSDNTLPNGARFYVDMGHPEYSTPETSNPRDLVIVDKAGERIVDMAARSAGKGIKIWKNNSDGQGSSYGCHENYLMKRMGSEDFSTKLVRGLMPFFVTRQLFSGSGKIGMEEPSSLPWHGELGNFSGQPSTTKPYTQEVFERNRDRVINGLETLDNFLANRPDFKQAADAVREILKSCNDTGEPEFFQLSQRGDFFETEIGLQTTSNRPIINTRDEPHADSSKYMRLHVICGDANMCEFATYLKAGTTALVLDLIEDGIAPNFDILNPVNSIKSISRDQTRRWPVWLKDGKTTSAIEIQLAYLNAAKKAYAGRDKTTDNILLNWGNTLEALATDPMQLSGKIDWVTKLNLLARLASRNQVTLTHQTIKNAALQYHDVDQTQGLFYALQKRGAIDRIVTDAEIEHAITNPPIDTRAYLRGKATAHDETSGIDWGGFDIRVAGKNHTVRLDEPFCGTKAQLGDLDGLSSEEFLQRITSQDGISLSKKSSFMQGFGKGKRNKRKKSIGPINPQTFPPINQTPSSSLGYTHLLPNDDDMKGGKE